MAKIVRLISLALTLALLTAIVTCSLAPSSYMTELAFIPLRLGEWADRNPNFRNFPVFAAFAFLLFFVSTLYQPPATRYDSWHISLGVFVVTVVIGVALEFMQRTLPGRWSNPWDVLWVTLGAFVGAFGAAFVRMMLCGLRANAV